MEKSCSLLVHFDKGSPALANEIKEALVRNDVAAKIEALKKAIMLLLNGETIPQLFFTIICYVLLSEDHTIQRLLLLYLEIIDMTDSRGKLLPETFLVCRHLRNNLCHPNEYIRVVTLRFLCPFNESEIIEPLIPSILSNLSTPTLASATTPSVPSCPCLSFRWGSSSAIRRWRSSRSSSPRSRILLV